LRSCDRRAICSGHRVVVGVLEALLRLHLHHRGWIGHRELLREHAVLRYPAICRQQAVGKADRCLRAWLCTGLLVQQRDQHYAASNATSSLTVSARTVTGSFTAADKVYDGSAAATITTRSLSGALSGDDVALSGGTASFDSKDVGTNKPVSGSGFTLAGTAKSNYTLGSVSGTTANITPKSISGSFTAADKPYDGTVAASIATRSVA